jgi:hypothetical protein
MASKTRREREYNAQRREKTRTNICAAILECEAAGDKTRASVAEKMGYRPDSVTRWLRDNEKDLPPEVAELAWVHGIIAPHVVIPKPKPAKKRYGKPVASQKAKVLRGWKQQVVVVNAKLPAEKITLSEMPFKIEGISEKYQWRAPQMGASHERAQN